MPSLLGYLQAHLRPTDDNHRVTTLELLFDLVFVYAITNVTGLMEHEIGAETVLAGLITLAVVWFGWCAYTWLGNQAQADEGLLRVGMVVAMGGMFFVAISIPYAFDDEGNAAVVLATAYAVVRFTHLGVYLIAAGDDSQLRSVILGMAGVATVMLVLLFTGAVIGGDAQKWWWLAAVASDQLGVYFVRSTRWRLNSAAHFAERFGLVIIIAIGESIVAVGVATSSATWTGATLPRCCAVWPLRCACGGSISTSSPRSPRTSCDDRQGWSGHDSLGTLTPTFISFSSPASCSWPSVWSS